MKLSGLMIAPNCLHLANAVFAICDHRGHCTSFGAQPSARGVDTDNPHSGFLCFQKDRNLANVMQTVRKPEQW